MPGVTDTLEKCNPACATSADPNRFLKGNLGCSWYLPYESNQEAFLAQLFSLTKATKHPGFVPDPGQGARKREIEKIPPGHRRGPVLQPLNGRLCSSVV